MYGAYREWSTIYLGIFLQIFQGSKLLISRHQASFASLEVHFDYTEFIPTEETLYERHTVQKYLIKDMQPSGDDVLLRGQVSWGYRNPANIYNLPTLPYSRLLSDTTAFSLYKLDC